MKTKMSYIFAQKVPLIDHDEKLTTTIFVHYNFEKYTFYADQNCNKNLIIILHSLA